MNLLLYFLILVVCVLEVMSWCDEECHAGRKCYHCPLDSNPDNHMCLPTPYPGCLVGPGEQCGDEKCEHDQKCHHCPLTTDPYYYVCLRGSVPLCTPVEDEVIEVTICRDEECPAGSECYNCPHNSNPNNYICLPILLPGCLRPKDPPQVATTSVASIERHETARRMASRCNEVCGPGKKCYRCPLKRNPDNYICLAAPIPGCLIEQGVIEVTACQDEECQPGRSCFHCPLTSNPDNYICLAVMLPGCRPVKGAPQMAYSLVGFPWIREPEESRCEEKCQPGWSCYHCPLTEKPDNYICLVAPIPGCLIEEDLDVTSCRNDEECEAGKSCFLCPLTSNPYNYVCLRVIILGCLPAQKMLPADLDVTECRNDAECESGKSCFLCPLTSNPHYYVCLRVIIPGCLPTHKMLPEGTPRKAPALFAYMDEEDESAVEEETWCTETCGPRQRCYHCGTKYECLTIALPGCVLGRYL